MSPLPPADLASREPLIITLAANEGLHRFHAAARDPIYFDRSLGGRLNAPDGSYGVLYTAKTGAGAFAETFLRTPGRRSIDPALHAAKAYAVLMATRPLTLIRFDGAGLARLGATAEIVHGGLPYTAPQTWSRALHDHPLSADGIAYTSRHDPDQLCYALFERAAPDIVVAQQIMSLDIDWFWELGEPYDVGRSPA